MVKPTLWSLVSVTSELDLEHVEVIGDRSNKVG